MKRAAQTAEIVNRHLGIQIQPLPNLREIDMDELFLKGWNQIAIEYPSFYREFQIHRKDVAYPGGESGLDAQQRVVPAIQEIVSSNPEGSDLAVACHGGVTWFC